MAERSFPFASVNGDRKYTDQDFRNYFAMLVTNGVFPVGTQLQVLAGTGMEIRVNEGAAWINGACYQVYGGSQMLSVPVADGVLDRIDRVVIRSDRTARKIYATVVKGNPSSEPAAPELVRDADFYDLSLATIRVVAGTTELTQADITDTRLDPEVCGIVSSLIRPDTTGWFEQFQDAFLTWFEGAKTVLDEEVAGNLYLTKYDKPLRFTNVSVPGDLWAADTTYPDYGYKADISLADVTANMVPDVVFPPEIATAGEVAPVAVCGAGYVRIYASAAQATMTIPTITVWKEV
ncbi:MAG: hypothetical protein ACOYIR_04695 [Christensenellales bacterium]|jgi:hypothetical protein